MQAAVRGLKGDVPDRMQAKNSRYIGSLVADFHRNLIAGGIFLYPGRQPEPEGQAAAALRGQTRWRSSPSRPAAPRPTGSTGSSTSCPTALHQRTPLVIGSRRGRRVRGGYGAARGCAQQRPGRPAGAVKTFYGPGDWAGDPGRDLGRPGEFPFTRGVHPSMYRGRLWTMRQYAGFGTAEETNRRFRQLLAAGQTGLSTAFDLPTQMGYDSDTPMAQGEVGRVGVAIDTVDDLADLFRGIPLDRVSTSMTINATAAILLAMYVVVGEEQGVPRPSSPARSRTTSSRSTSRGARTSTRRARRCGWWPTSSASWPTRG